MEVVIKSSPTEASKSAALLIKKTILNDPACVLGLATGSTPLKTYEELIKLYQEKIISFKKVVSFNLDEYVGLAPADKNSYRSFMNDNFFTRTDIQIKNTHLPNALPKSIPEECKDFESKIKKAGGIDLQLLGIGLDGHIGFNEPGSSLNSRTRMKTLTPETRLANSKYFSAIDRVPKHVITMGLGTIMEAKICLLLAFGDDKAQAIADMIEGPVTASVPASVLQFHPRCIAIIDESAAAMLKRKNYYTQVYDDKPGWQRWE